MSKTARYAAVDVGAAAHSAGVAADGDSSAGFAGLDATAGFGAPAPQAGIPAPRNMAARCSSPEPSCGTSCLDVDFTGFHRRMVWPTCKII